MKNKNIPTIEQIEQRLSVWEKWLYACYSASFIMLVHAFIKNHENTVLSGALFFIENEAGVTNSPANFETFYQYFTDLFVAFISPGRLVLWLVIQLAILISAATLAFHPTWKKIMLSKRLDMIFGYLLAGWITLLSLGAQDQLNAGGGYNAIVVVYLLALGLGYRLLRRKKDKAEEVFP